MWHICSVRIVYLVNCGTSSHFQAAKLIPAEVRRQQTIAFLAFSLGKRLGESWNGLSKFHFQTILRHGETNVPFGYINCTYFLPVFLVYSFATHQRERKRVWDRWLAFGRHTGKCSKPSPPDGGSWVGQWLNMYVQRLLLHTSNQKGAFKCAQ